MPVDVDQILKSLEPLRRGEGTSLDLESRSALIVALHDSAANLEGPWDMFMRLANWGRWLPMIHVGHKLGIFQALAAAKEPLTLDNLCKPTGADPQLVRRIMRYLAANSLVSAQGKDVYQASRSTQLLADRRLEGAAKFWHSVCGPILQILPAALEEKGFQTLADKDDAGLLFRKAHGTDLDCFRWMAETRPDLIEAFSGMMNIPRDGDWLDSLAFPDVTDDGRPVFVDVGGSIGHHASHFLARYPEFAGRVVVQDLPEVVKGAKPVQGVEFMTHDFFTPQTVKNAHVYYLSAILHDWSDEDSITILKQLVPGMAADSRGIIDEMVLPDIDSHFWPATLDLEMMLLFKHARERTRDEWIDILGRAGLELVDIKTYNPVTKTSLIISKKMQ